MTVRFETSQVRLVERTLSWQSNSCAFDHWSWYYYTSLEGTISSTILKIFKRLRCGYSRVSFLYDFDIRTLVVQNGWAIRIQTVHSFGEMEYSSFVPPQREALLYICDAEVETVCTEVVESKHLRHVTMMLSSSVRPLAHLNPRLPK